MGRRIAGIDVARGLALLGMFVSHAAPPVSGDGPAAFLVEVPDERSRLLFAVTAGLGLGLLTGGTDPPGPARRSVLRRQIAIRAFCLLILGMALQSTGVLVRVILDEYGLAFLFMLPLVFLPARWLIAGGATLLAVAPGTAAAIAAWAHPVDPWQLTDWFVTGSYPVFTWVAVLMLGVGIVRLGLGRRSVVVASGLLGVVAMVTGLGLSVGLGGDGIASEPVAGPAPTTASIASVAAGTSAFTIGNVGFCLALTMLFVGLTSTVSGISRRAARASSTLLSPIAAAGSMPLSVYTAHLIVLLAVTRRTPGGYLTDNGWPVVIGLVIAAVTLPWLWRSLVGRGPLEIAIGLLSGRIRLSLPRSQDPDDHDVAGLQPRRS